jgi:chromosome condensin MukBEF ATPase and DNA-binding subunit MukB
MTAWLIAQRERVHELELEQARLAGELAASERIERAGQRYADRLEEKLAEARKREASLARALGYAEAQRDQLLARLGAGSAAPPGLEPHGPLPRAPRSARRP